MQAVIMINIHIFSHVQVSLVQVECDVSFLPA